ncbi:MAG: c-type cytochrome [Hyphomicrobium sp.]|jgi:cytochrome c peroxidase|nr:c-type cytochrome [Hyphomicrobium sp.]
MLNRLSGFVLVLALSASGGVVWSQALPRSAEQPPPADRDQIWRSIFARPQPRPADALETKRQALGALLFFDKRLSRDNDRSCATCHQPDNGYSDGEPRARGRDGTPLTRNTPHLFNLADATSFYWDGREPTLEQQARVPITTDNELAAGMETAAARLSADGELRARFAEAFPGETELSEMSILDALAAFERSLVSPETRFDAWVRGDADALDETELLGFRIFVGKGGCVSCHGGWRMTDDSFHDVGLPLNDPGRSAVPGGVAGIAAFKTPGLRQVSKTAPYMHDGSLATLDAVVDHYAGNLIRRPSLSPNVVRDLDLDDGERAALVAFLKTL